MKGEFNKKYLFSDKIKEVCKDNPFRPASSSRSFHISNTNDGLHIFIGKESQSSFNATITNRDGVTVNINNDNVIPMGKENSTENKDIDVDAVKNGASNFFDTAKNTINKIKSAIDTVNDFSEGFKVAYKKTTKAMSKMFIAVAVVSSIAQIGNVASIAHTNDYSWTPTVTELNDYYAPLYEDFNKNKDIYSICEQDKSLCITSGALVGLVATKSMALTGAGAAMMVAGDVSEDRTRLNTFLQSIEKATGYALTKETSERNKIDRENENLLKEQTPLVSNNVSTTPYRLEDGRLSSSIPIGPEESGIDRTAMQDRVRDTSEISKGNSLDGRINRDKYQRIRM
jgi:hypothetical protein